MWSDWLVFCDCDFHSVCPLMDKDKRLVGAPWWKGPAVGNLGLALMCRATKDGQVMMQSSDKTWSTGEGNGKPLQYSCLENPINNMKRQKVRTMKDELPRSVGAHYATGDQWRNNPRKNEETEPKQKQYPDVDVTGDRSKVRCCKEQYCIGTWNVRSMNQGNWKWSNKRWQE